MNKPLLIFDCDGVLVDSEILGNQAMVDQLKVYDIHITLDQALEWYKGKSMQGCIDGIEERHSIKLPESFPADYRTRMKASFEANLQPVKNIPQALDQLKEYPKAVGSNGPLEKIKNSLRITKLSHHFNDNLFSAHTRQKYKPDPDLFLNTASTLGFAPENCIVIEDSPLGVQAARSAGMKSFGYISLSSSEDLKAAGAHPFDDMSDLPQLIKTLV